MDVLPEDSSVTAAESEASLAVGNSPANVMSVVNSSLRSVAPG
jgi:hypothetical protein